jgi:hypothetical protein
LRILRDGELVWSATQSLLRVGVKQTSGQPFTSQFASDTALSCQTEFTAPADIGRRYGAVSGDRNPIHLTAVTAKLFGFQQAIAHGMWTKGTCPVVFAAGPSFGARFHCGGIQDSLAVARARRPVDRALQPRRSI